MTFYLFYHLNINENANQIEACKYKMHLNQELVAPLTDEARIS